MHKHTFALVASLSFAASLALADNETQWRGKDRSGIVPAANLAQEWPAEGPKKLWTVPVGIGFGSPVALDGKVYLFHSVDEAETLEAFDAEKGTSLWKYASPKTRYAGGYKGVRCTPLIDGGKIYTLGSDALLTARNLADGKELWVVDLLTETGSKLGISAASWGNSSNLLLDGDVFYCQVREMGNAAVCVNKNDGKIVWKSEAKGGGYASPALAEVSGTRMLLCFGHETLVAMEPKTGKTLWTLNEPWETQYNINASMPIIHDAKMFLTVAYKNGHCGLYQLSPTGATRIWGGPQVTGRFQAAILDNGHLYVNSEGTLKCVKWEDGSVVWSSPASERQILNNGGSIIRFGNKLICTSERGMLTLVKATPQGFEKISQVKGAVEGKQVWATPLVYNGKLYVKGETELTCFEIAAK